MTEGNPFTEKSHSRLSQTSELEIMNKLKEPTTTLNISLSICMRHTDL